MDYPVLEILSDLRETFRHERIVILQAPPGAGKSTVLPQRIMKEPWLDGKKVIMLEPRRLAARSVAMRIAELLKEPIGKTAGYRIRFDSRVSADTRIEVVTEGIFTRMIQSDNALEEVGLIIFDEFHERSLQSDLALALTLQVQQVLRPDLRILIMSATLDGEKLSTLLNAPVISSSGREHPVKLKYLGNEDATPIAVRAVAAVRKAFHEETGDILCFLPGAGEIQRTAELLGQANLSLSIYPLFGDIPFRKQQEAIMPHPAGMRKVVIATSIAETSLTIEGITVVIDSGFARVPRFDPRSGLTRLETVRVTKDAADQRAGRAGRLGPGICYRMWGEGRNHTLVPHRVPEILEADLTQLVLELHVWGLRDVNSLMWISRPPIGAIQQATELLTKLGALDEKGITVRGKKMAGLPTHPRIAHLLLEGQSTPANAALAADIAALLEERDPLPRDSGADLTLRIELLRRWRRGERVNADRNLLERIEKLASTWRRSFGTSTANDNVVDKAVGALILEAYPERIARQVEKHGGRYRLLNGRYASLPSHDPLSREPWLAIAHLDAGSAEGKIFLAAPLDEADLVGRAVEKRNVYWDNERAMVAVQTEKLIGNLVLSGRTLHEISEEESAHIICNLLREKGLKLLNWDQAFAQWQARVLSLKLWRPGDHWPDVSDEQLVETLETWFVPFLQGIRKLGEIQRLEPEKILPSIMPWDLNRRLDALAPTRLQVPSGSNIKVEYFANGSAPVMEVRLQEVFGLHETPAVNEGRTKIIMHLLSPGYKPVQVTQDLKSFWSTTYAEVRKELRTRYPKHSWPEDPWTAPAVRGAKRKIG